jgi:hypothetical protein
MVGPGLVERLFRSPIVRSDSEGIAEIGPSEGAGVFDDTGSIAPQIEVLGHFNRQVRHLQSGCRGRGPGLPAARLEELAQLQRVKSLLVEDLATASGDRFPEQFGEKTFRAPRIFGEAGKSLDDPRGGAIERFVIPGREPGVQQSERMPGGEVIGAIPAFGTEGEMLIDSSSLAGRQLARDESLQSLPIRVVCHCRDEM